MFAAGTTVSVVLVTGIPTDLIDTPLFTRDVPVTWWAWPVLIMTALLSGLVAATYVARKDASTRRDSGSRFGMTGAVMTFFAVGCPVCNKLVLLALGYTGAIQFFEPVQPYLAVVAIGALGWALVWRIRRERTCPLRPDGASGRR
ncbi:hypothetical protein GCM10027344_14540 [Spelaeicoccus albus]